MTDSEFIELCTQYPDEFVEVTAEGEIIIAPPSYTLDGVRSGEIRAQLEAWASGNLHGYVTGCTAGFVLPNGARRMADAAWTSARRIRALSEESRRTYWRLSPDFVMELHSIESMSSLRAKMREWIDNGAQLGWLVDPERQTVEIFRPGQEAESRIEIVSLAGEGPIQGFVLDLRRVWDPLAD